MPTRVNEVVSFRGDKLFNGAVNVGWFGTDLARADAAARSFVFHGPDYHGVTQKVVGEERLLTDQGRIRDIVQAPDGALYVLVDDAGKVLRVTPA